MRRFASLSLLTVTVAGALASGLAACERRPRELQVDEVALSRGLDAHIAEAIERPEVDAALAKLLDDVFADPRVATAGEKLFATLGEDPQIAAQAGALINALVESPEMQAAIMKIMSANPGAGEAELIGLLEARVDRTLEGPVFDTAFDRAFDRMLAMPVVAGAFGRLEDAVGRSDVVSRDLERIVTRRTSDRAFVERIVRLNGGKMPDRARASELLLEHVFTVDHLAAFYKSTFSQPVLRKELADLAADLCTSESFQRSVRVRVSRLLNDEDLRAKMGAVILVVLDEKPTAEQLEAALVRVLESPVAAEQVAGLIDDVLASPELARLGEKALDRVVSDPGFTGVVEASFFTAR